MIFGHITNNIPPVLPVSLQRGLAFLRETPFNQYTAGKIEIDGQRIYAQLLDLTTRHANELYPEVHRRYIDIHYLLQGEERIGVANDNGDNLIHQAYDSERDILFYQRAENESWLTLSPGDFAIFFPKDIHRPGCCQHAESAIKKVVVKVLVNALE